MAAQGYTNVAEGYEMSPPKSTRSKGHAFNVIKIFVGGLPQSCDREKLRDYFVKFGRITDAVVMIERSEFGCVPRHRGFGYCTFADPASVEAAVAQYNEHFIDGKWVEVKRCIPQDKTNGFDKNKVFERSYDGRSGRSIAATPRGNPRFPTPPPPPSPTQQGAGKAASAMVYSQPPAPCAVASTFTDARALGAVDRKCAGRRNPPGMRADIGSHVGDTCAAYANYAMVYSQPTSPYAPADTYSPPDTCTYFPSDFKACLPTISTYPNDSCGPPSCQPNADFQGHQQQHQVQNKCMMQYDPLGQSPAGFMTSPFSMMGMVSANGPCETMQPVQIPTPSSQVAAEQSHTDGSVLAEPEPVVSWQPHVVRTFIELIEPGRLRGSRREQSCPARLMRGDSQETVSSRPPSALSEPTRPRQESDTPPVSLCKVPCSETADTRSELQPVPAG